VVTATVLSITTGCPSLGDVEAVRVLAVRAGLDPANRLLGDALDRGAGRGGDRDPALGDPRLDEEGVGGGLLGGDVVEVPVGQARVLDHVGVGDARVDPGANTEPAAPPPRNHGGLQRGQVRSVHGHQAPLGDVQARSRGVDEPNAAGQHPAAQVQLAAIPLRGQPACRPPRAVLDAQIEQQPVRRVDQVLVLHLAGPAPCWGAVVHPGQVSAR
jgi:hypothetical protein